MHEEEAFVHKPVHRTDEERKEYRREWMAKKRAAEKLKKDLGEDRSGEVSLGSVETESVVETIVGETDGVTSDTVTQNLDEVQWTPTDAKFEAQRPGYWIYGKEVKERECWKCGDKFETRLEMNKFCSPQCKEKWLSDAFGKLRVQEKANL